MTQKKKKRKKKRMSNLEKVISSSHESKPSGKSWQTFSPWKHDGAHSVFSKNSWKKIIINIPAIVIGNEKSGVLWGTYIKHLLDCNHAVHLQYVAITSYLFSNYYNLSKRHRFSCTSTHRCTNINGKRKLREKNQLR